mmetsp:Transcript_75158/g.151081  ORF Transcript_75158/g.151081 Transcript_75158/m.151081 type:complete len:204 (+) Transcript_75158:484-1095(+)
MASEHLVKEADAGVPLFRQADKRKIVRYSVLRPRVHQRRQLHVVGAAKPQHHFRHAPLHPAPVKVRLHGFAVLGQNLQGGVSLQLRFRHVRDLLGPVAHVALHERDLLPHQTPRGPRHPVGVLGVPVRGDEALPRLPKKRHHVPFGLPQVPVLAVVQAHVAPHHPGPSYERAPPQAVPLVVKRGVHSFRDRGLDSRVRDPDLD